MTDVSFLPQVQAYPGGVPPELIRIHSELRASFPHSHVETWDDGLGLCSDNPEGFSTSVALGGGFDRCVVSLGPAVLSLHHEETAIAIMQAASCMRSRLVLTHVGKTLKAWRLDHLVNSGAWKAVAEGGNLVLNFWSPEVTEIRRNRRELCHGALSFPAAFLN